jgi:hypothetical protein
MYQRLKAEESLDVIEALLASEGRTLEDHARTRYLAGLERRAEGEQRPKRVSVDDLAAMGIRVAKDGE